MGRVMRIGFRTKLPSPARLARIISVVAIAIAAGHMAQALAARRAAGPEPEQLAMIVPRDIVLLSAANMNLAEALLDMPAPLAALPVMPAAFGLDETLPPSTPAPQTAAQARPCDMDLTLSEAAQAIIAVRVLAPCRAGERVVLRHEGLAVTGRLDGEGALRMDLPALTAAARVDLAFGDGAILTEALEIAAVGGLHRFGVQWQGPEAFAVHGFENGADFGQPGHVSPAHPGVAEGGMLTLLGDPSVDLPLLAQIYTYPAADMPVEILVEAAVTPLTCGQDLLGEVITARHGRVEITELTLAMPDCGGADGFLVLKNLPAEMKLAAN